MIVANWNIRGVNQPYKQREVSSLVHKHMITIMGLIETKVHEAQHQRIIQTMLPGWIFLTNYICHPNGRIWVLWNPSLVSIKSLSITDQVIHVEALFLQN